MANVYPVLLRCEYRENPIGIDVPRPRLFWKLRSDARYALQTGYQIQVGSSYSRLVANEPDLWDSGRIESEENTHVEYGGRPLGSLERAVWRVRVWDGNGEESDWSEPAFWESGLLTTQDWQGQWIGGMRLGGPRTSAPAPFLRREVTLERPVVAARLAVTALGLYEFSLNGLKVGRDLLTPGWTDYRKRVQYQVYDVTDQLTQGANCLGAILGDGWFCGHVEWRGRELYGDRPALLAQLVVQYDDGSVVSFATDRDWRYAFGPIVENDLIMGEAYDARREMPGWDTPGFDASSWLPVEVVPAPEGTKLVAMSAAAVQATEEIKPISINTISKWPKPDHIFDLGQNMVGRVRLRVKGTAGQTVRLRFAEVLKPDGNLYTESLRSAKQTDFYTLKGDPDGEVWESKFTFHGFRYVEVTGIEGDPTLDTITGVVMHTDIPKTGEFECSDELVNQLQRNIDWGQRGNFVDIPTDCPQRDERLGWTGDAQVFIRTAAFNRDVAGFFTKWLNDLEDSQGPSGEIPPVAPNTNAMQALGDDGGPAWADAFVICPWTIYLCYGDTTILREHYDGMAQFVDYLESKSIGLVRSHPEAKGFSGFGDWLSTNAETPNELIGTAFLAHSAQLMSKIAGVLGKAEDQTRYASLFENVRTVFQNRFVTPDGFVTARTQTAYVLALHFDLVRPEHRPVVAQSLVDDIGRRGYHLSTGFVGTPYLNQVLTDAGRNDVAYQLLFQKTFPSWLYPVTQGATTIWERWDGWTHDKGFQDPGMNSFNHYAYGAIGAWLYSVVAGIDLDEARPGYRHIHFRPQPGGDLTHAKASLETLHGPVECSWKMDDYSSFSMEVVVPPGCTATAHIPVNPGHQVVADGGDPLDSDGTIASFALGSGRYRFDTYQTPADEDLVGSVATV